MNVFFFSAPTLYQPRVAQCSMCSVCSVCVSFYNILRSMPLLVVVYVPPALGESGNVQNRVSGEHGGQGIRMCMCVCLNVCVCVCVCLGAVKQFSVESDRKEKSPIQST